LIGKPQSKRQSVHRLLKPSYYQSHMFREKYYGGTIYSKTENLYYIRDCATLIFSNIGFENWFKTAR